MDRKSRRRRRSRWVCQHASVGTGAGGRWRHRSPPWSHAAGWAHSGGAAHWRLTGRIRFRARCGSCLVTIIYPAQRALSVGRFVLQLLSSLRFLRRRAHRHAPRCAIRDAAARGAAAWHRLTATASAARTVGQRPPKPLLRTLRHASRQRRRPRLTWLHGLARYGETQCIS